MLERYGRGGVVRGGEGRCAGEIWERRGGVVWCGEGRCAGEIWKGRGGVGWCGEGRGGGVGLVGVISPALFLCCGCL